MLTDLLPDPFLWFSHHQWGILLSGMWGAIFSGLIAVGVLVWTLRTQRTQFREQLDAQKGDLDAQLEAQSDALGKQLEAQAAGISEQAKQQAAEASKERELAARAEIIVAVQELMTSNGSPDAKVAICLRIANGIEKWRFELQSGEDQALWNELDAWRPVPPSLLHRLYPFGGPKLLSEAAAGTLLKIACGHLLNAVIELRRNFDGKNWTSDEVARVMREFRVKSLTAPPE